MRPRWHPSSRLRHLILGLATLLGSGGPSPGATSPAPGEIVRLAAAEARRALELGETELAESRYRTAIQEGWLLLGTLALASEAPGEARPAFERALVAAAPIRTARMSLAAAQLRLGEPSEAVLLLREALAEDPTDLQARQLLARALAAQGEDGLALQELEELRVLDPENLELLYQLATIHLREDDPEAAAEILEELAERRPIPQTHVLIGRTWRDYENYERARASLRRALELDPDVRRAHYYLGTTELLDGGHQSLDAAAEHLEAELARVPDDPMSNFYLGMVRAEQRRHADAIPRLELASRAKGMPPDVFKFLGRSYLAEDRPELAVEAFRKGLEVAERQLEQMPEDSSEQLRENRIARLHYQLAVALRRSGDEEGATEHFDAAKRFSARYTETSRETLDRFLRGESTTQGTASTTSLPFESPTLAGLGPDERDRLRAVVADILAESYTNLGILHVRDGRFARAAEDLRLAVELGPESERAQYALGVALFNSEQYVLAKEPLEAARKRRPDDPSLRRMLALASFHAGDYEQARELLRDDPERARDPSLDYTYALALVRSGRGEEAEPIFTRLLTANEAWPELHVVVGQAHAQQGDFEAAMASLERAIEIDPGVAEAHSTLGEIFLRQGELEKAESSLRAELGIRPEHPEVLYDLAVVLDLRGRSEEALDVLRNLLAEHPGLSDGRYLLGKILLAEGSPEEAREQLEAAIGLAPENPHPHYQLGQAYQQLGRSDDAMRQFEIFRRLKNAEREPEGSR